MGNKCGKKENIVEDEPDPDSGLTRKEVQLIRQVWSVITDKSTLKDNGTQFFLKLFREHPHMQEYFTQFINQDLASLELSMAMRAHGIVVFTSITTYVDLLDDPPSLIAVFYKRAISHFRRGIDVGEYEKMKAVLLEFLKEKTTGMKNSAEGLAAWDKFLTWHNAVIRAKYEELLKQCSLVMRPKLELLRCNSSTIY